MVRIICFWQKVEAVQVGEEYLDKKGRLQLGKAGLLAYSHGEYLTLGKTLGTFGWSVRKLSASGKKKRHHENERNKNKINVGRQNADAFFNSMRSK